MQKCICQISYEISYYHNKTFGGYPYIPQSDMRPNIQLLSNILDIIFINSPEYLRIQGINDIIIFK